MTPRISVVAAARPNFMKVGPVLRALQGKAVTELVHTGQHYDDAMAGAFFRDLGLPTPDVDLGIGSGTHAQQTAGVMVAYEARLLEERPDAVVVVGDVNSTLAATLAAVKLGIPVAHVEAGLRSGDLTMPEEQNRLVVDRLARWLFTPSPDGDEHLLREGADPDRIFRVGNVMVDTLLSNLPAARVAADGYLAELDVQGPYVLATLHRPSNVGDLADIVDLVVAIADIAPDMPVLFPAHPRTAQMLEGTTLPPTVRLLEPLGYHVFTGLQERAAIVATDSGGVQEETSVLGVPCLTLRPNTERPITIEEGTNTLVGTDPTAIVAAGRAALQREHRPAQIEGWDGKAGERIADVLLATL